MIVNTLTKQLLFCTTRIQTSGPRGTGSGTGFIYTLQGNDFGLPLLVTNKHVIEGASQCHVRFSRLNASGDGPDLTSRPVDVIYQGIQWTGHPDPDIDIAVLPLAQTFMNIQERGDRIFHKSIGPDLCPNEAQLADLDAVEPITFVGYPNGLYDSVHNTPIVRQGVTATPIELDYEGKPIFLVDASVFPGSSGSPVFIVQEGSYRSKGNLVVGSRIIFLGVIAAVMQQATIGQIVQVAAPGVVTPQMIDLGIVFKWSTIDDVVDRICQESGIDRADLNSVSPEPRAIQNESAD
ncbi:serine protease [Streptomyces sp. NPDC013161]|uniref:S1 family peptidase n=1 Tax=Streptomyces sp. NPDC013161 TaxID=3364862 RepID=UPI0036D09BC4